MTEHKDHSLFSLTIEDGANMRLDRWLRKKYPGLQQGMLEKMFRQGKIRLDGQKTTSGCRLQNGQIVTLPTTLTSIEPSPLPMKKMDALNVSNADLAALQTWIIWEDEELLVLNKPHGLAVQGGTQTTRHLDGMLTVLGLKNGCKYRLVHRLDRDTSGVFVVAKTQETAAHLSAAFRYGNHEKTYWAVVMGFAQPGKGIIEARLLKGGNSGDREKVIVDPNGKPATTHYCTLKKLSAKRLPELTWLELIPETGRTHQLRVHCESMGFPILGDGKYGGKMATEIDKKLHLHARSIKIKDRAGDFLTFVAPPPPHFEETLLRYQIEWNRVV